MNNTVIFEFVFYRSVMDFIKNFKSTIDLKFLCHYIISTVSSLTYHQFQTYDLEKFMMGLRFKKSCLLIKTVILNSFIILITILKDKNFQITNLTTFS